ncbi:MAG TPA: YhjD/YihY/BrkB family envelope integrity protein, partial [Gaiellaceae bacterium]|nr:YhjD/YihY/BrkB family envelope integrity protein [Gaiellaceae bacterium]
MTRLSRADYLAILRRAVREASDDHITSIAAALAYYAFLSIPSALLVAVGAFSLVADAGTVATLVDKLDEVVPSEAATLIRDSLTQMTQRDAG